MIHNWADAEAIRPGTKDNPFAREHGLADKFVVMHSGNVGLSQDVDGLLDVAERLRDLRDVVVAIVGEGSRKMFLKDEAERRSLRNVRFFPYQPKARPDGFVRHGGCLHRVAEARAAGFIVPSKLYGILAAGRPFIAAVEDDCEAAQIAREYECGVVVEPGDRDAMAAAIRRPVHGPGCAGPAGRSKRARRRPCLRSSPCRRGLSRSSRRGPAMSCCDVGMAADQMRRLGSTVRTRSIPVRPIPIGEARA